MKNFFSILILCCYFFSATEARELLKLPLLFEHFAEHKKLKGTMGMWEFLCIHYAHGNPRDADYDKDMKLPFKTCSCSHFDKPFNVIEAECKLPSILNFEYRAFLNDAYSDLTLSRDLDCIWQPPKCC